MIYRLDDIQQNKNYFLKDMPINADEIFSYVQTNIRKNIFQNLKVRMALNLAWDFEWYNKNLAYGAYTRTDSYFDNSELGSKGLLSNAGEEERLILEKYRERLPKKLYSQVYVPPSSLGKKNSIRQNLRQAGKLLKEAGWKVFALIFVFYLIRDIILYILIQYLVAKGLLF